MKGYIGPKMKYIRKIGSEIFNVFIYGAEGVNVPAWWRFWIFLKILIRIFIALWRAIFWPKMKYISKIGSEIFNVFIYGAEGVNVPAWWPFGIFLKILIRIFIALWRAIFGPKMKYIRKIGSEIFNVFIYGAEGVNVPAWWSFWIFLKILIRIFIALWRAIFGPKMKYIRKIGSEIFNVFIYGAEGVNVPAWWSFWIFLKILIRIFIALWRAIFGPKMKYISKIGSEIFNVFIYRAEGVNVPVWWPFGIFLKILIRIFIALWRAIFGPKMKYIRKIGSEIFNVFIYGAEEVNVPVWWPFGIFLKILIRIFIALWRAIFGPKMKYIRKIGSEIFNVFIYGAEEVNVPVWWPFWICSKFLIRIFIAPWRAILGPKMKYIRKIGSEIFNVFIYGAEEVNVPVWWPFGIFIKILIRIFIALWRAIFGPKMKYIRKIGSEIFNVFIYGAEEVNVPVWWPFWICSKFLIRIFIAPGRAILGPKMKYIRTIGFEIFTLFKTDGRTDERTDD